jgi:4-amino-4-deoxy-L-arabinose transferase
MNRILTSTDAGRQADVAVARRVIPTIVLGVGVLVFYLLIYLLPLGFRPLLIPDETRYAEIPREMLTTGDWVTPRLNGLRYFEKPPLGYWLNAASIAAFDEHEFAVRLASALSAGLTTLLVFLLARQLTRERYVPLLAALIHMTFIEVYLIGVTNVLDTPLTLFLTAGIAAFYYAARSPDHKSLWWLSGVAFGLAFLTKGFLAFAVPVLVLVPWMLLQGTWRTLMIKGWQVVLAAILVVLPWSVLIHLHETDFWRYFFWIEHLKRFTSDNAQHKESFFYFLIYLPALAFPWLSLAPAAVAGLWRPAAESRTDRGTLLFLWLWLVLPFLFFSASSGKLLTYILPCFPPLAVLTATGLVRYFCHDRSRLFDYGIWVNTLLFLCLLVALWLSQTMEIGFRVYAKAETGKVALLSTALLVCIAAGFHALLVNNARWKLASAVAMIVPILFIASFVLPERVLEHKAPEPLLAPFKNRLGDNAIVIAEADVVHAAAWYLQRHDIYLIGGGETGYGLSYPDAAGRLLDPVHFAALMTQRSPRQPVLMICHHGCDGRYVKLLPKTARKQTWGQFTVWFKPGQQ